MKPTLVIMAAGMGSRYGGLKQIDPVGPHGELIIDYSLYDALEAGFGRVVFVIKASTAAEFREVIGDRVSAMVETHYAFQDLEDLPPSHSVPPGREKPWGTAHAVFSARHLVDGPFAVINADDYYGKEAFGLMSAFLKARAGGGGRQYAMVGFLLENTLTEHGHVARGVCVTGEDGTLLGTRERTHVERRDGRVQYTEDNGKRWVDIPAGSVASMNLWGFTPDIMPELERLFGAFLDRHLPENPLKSEFFLPFAVNTLIEEGKAAVKVLPSPDRWYGVTYREDKPVVTSALARLRAEGVYPRKLWD